MDVKHVPLQKEMRINKKNSKRKISRKNNWTNKGLYIGSEVYNLDGERDIEEIKMDWVCQESFLNLQNETSYCRISIWKVIFGRSGFTITYDIYIPGGHN